MNTVSLAIVRLPLVAVFSALTLLSPRPADAAAASAVPPASTLKIPAGDYTLDKSHASLLFKVNHLGFSRFTARFTSFDATLRFDPARPATARVEATIDPRSIASDNAPAGFLESLQGAEWLDAAKFGPMTFRSTSVAAASARQLRVTGDFTLHGVTRPLTLDVTFNGGYAGHPMDPNARIGFSGRGKLKRSDFGISFGVPAPGSQMGVGDEVDIVLEAEFTGPPLAAAPGSAAKR